MGYHRHWSSGIQRQLPANSALEGITVVNRRVPFYACPSKDNLQGELNVKRLAGTDAGRSIGVPDRVSDAAEASRTEGRISDGAGWCC